jgi:hypothetical protein
LAGWGRRLGYLAFVVAMVVFAAGLATNFTRVVSATVVAGLVVGSVLLVPAIILGYAVKAADREDRDRRRPS